MAVSCWSDFDDDKRTNAMRGPYGGCERAKGIGFRDGGGQYLRQGIFSSPTE